ncbi:alpha/beta hydrolase [Acidipila rosea]|nr:alpha/beta hydrolase-fold protein [Acidipila rosea]
MHRLIVAACYNPLSSRLGPKENVYLMSALFTRFRTLCTLCLIPFSFLLAAGAQTPGKGHVDTITVHGKSLEGNLIGDTADREVKVYLPPSYATHPERRYPVVYMLHGFTDSADKWFGAKKDWVDLDTIADSDIDSGKSKEMIIVVPNAMNPFAGSFYSRSVTTGDWEDFVAHDLVSYIDAHYRTIANRDSRGLAGHSMGGYGTMRIGMRHTDVFSVIYAMSPCCLVWDNTFHPGGGPGEARKLTSIHTMADVKKADFNTLVSLALSAAWSPDPKKPPFYFDLPVTSDGKPVAPVAAEWSANMPLVFLPQYIPQLKSLHAIAFDAGTHDEFKSIPLSLVVLDKDLNDYGIAHTYETYDGTHTSRVPERLADKVLPFFSKNLKSDN